MKHSIPTNYFSHWSIRIPGLLTSPHAIGPHCPTWISFCLATNPLPSYIVPAPEIPEQLNVNHTFILLLPLWVLALLLPTFYSRENQGRGSLNTWTTAVVFYSLITALFTQVITEKQNVINNWTTDSSTKTRTIFLANTQKGISHCFTHHNTSLDTLREAWGENTIIIIIWEKHLWGLWQQTLDSYIYTCTCI